MKTLLLLVLPLTVSVFAACHDDHDHDDGEVHTSPFASCQAIIDACHPKDTGDGPAHDCHDVAHDTAATEAACAARRDSCIATCNAVGADAGSTTVADASSSGG